MNGDIQGYESTSQGTFIQNIRSNKSCYKLPFGHQLLGGIKLDKDQYLLFQKTPNSSEIGILDSCVYRTIINDPCLNFQNKIKGVFKYHNGSRRAYWIEEGNPFRYIDIDCPPKFQFNTCEGCPQPEEEFDCDALNINKIIDLPSMSLEEIAGNLPNGSYQIAIAFSEAGQRLSD